MSEKKHGVTIRIRMPGIGHSITLLQRRFLIAKRLIYVIARRMWSFWNSRNRNTRFGVLFIVSALIISNIASVLSPFLTQTTYALGKAGNLLEAVDTTMASNLTLDTNQQTFNFDSKQGAVDGTAKTSYGGVTATAHVDGSKGVSVTDSTNKVNFSMTPKFHMADGQKDGNRIVYPLLGYDGWAVYTMNGAGAKEDILLNSARNDTMSLDYDMGLGSGMVARVESNGSVGIYGNKLLSSNISAGTDKDAALLAKARDNASKDTLLFTIPAPTVKETARDKPNVTATYEVNGNTLTVNVKGLKIGNYPLTIDPSIYVVTAYQFMAGNNETNINFDVNNKLIKKGSTTGGRFNSWQTTANLPTGSFGGGSVASGGYIYQIGGASSNGTVYSTAGSSTYIVPNGVTSITIKAWGGGGGSGAGATTNIGAAGGGGGFVSSTLTVTPGETLNIKVGGGGGAGTIGGNGGGEGGGGGGGYSSVYRSTTPLLLAAGGGGGGGGLNSFAGSAGAGGAGGGTTGVAGTTTASNTGGGGGTPSAGGAAGVQSGGFCNGLAGSALTGGGTMWFNGGCATTTQLNGGINGGGAGANPGNGGGGGGGGGAGYFGGGGGAGISSNTVGAGGGGGSSYTTGTGPVNTAGSGLTPGNGSDGNRGTAGNGGAQTAATTIAGNSGSTGLVVVSSATANVQASAGVNWAQFDTGDGTVVNANPGNGTCSGWCSTAGYNLPANRSNFSLVAYNGYLYAMGGNDETGSSNLNHKYKTVYIAKLGANGEPRLWHPTDSNQSNWGYWFTSSSTLPSERIQGAAVAYNNKMYFIGGVDNSSATGATNSTVWVASILPTGDLGAWTTTTALTSGGPGATFGATALAYNDRLYLIGGAGSIGSTAATTNAYYIKINSDGTLASSWIHTNDFATGRTTGGGTNATIWGGYVYISGGCGATTSSNYCNSPLSDTQIASINADGSLDTWRTISGVTNQSVGASLMAWRNTIYNVGGCPSQNTTSGDCLSGIQSGINYGTIVQDGDVSTPASSVTTGTNCTAATSTNCDITATTVLSTTVVSNGWLYVIGGCTNVGCTTTTNNVYLTQISANGDLVKPTTCPAGTAATTTTVGYCLMTAKLPGNRAGATATVFNGTIYLVGGFVTTGLADNIDRATLNADGGVGAWTNQSLTTAGGTSVSQAYAYSRANPTSAGTNPGNLYIFGGCTNAGLSCTATTANVYKCAIAVAGTVSGCSTTNQLQIGTVPGASGAGLGAANGAVYSNYIYLVSGASPGITISNKVRYAKFDNSNNIVTAGSGWTESTQTLTGSRLFSTSFAYNGYLYTVGGSTDGSAMLGDINYIKLNTATGDLSTDGWKISTAAVTGRMGATATAANGNVYVIGGCSAAFVFSCSALSSSVQRLKVYNNDSGTPAAYTAGNEVSTSTIGASSVIYNGYIYQTGGCTNIGCTTFSNATNYAPINSDGTIGTWATGGNLPSSLAWGSLLSTGGTLYYVGGQTGNADTTAVNTIYYTSGISSGNPTWNGSAVTKGIGDSGSGAQARTKFGATVWNNQLYVVGGNDATPTGQTTVYVSPVQKTGGNITQNWISTSAFTTARSGLSVVAYANNLYIIGGNNGTNYLSDVQYSKINTADGSVGSWSYSTSLPAPLSDGSAFAANGYIYVVGGRSAVSTCTPKTLVAPISANTPISLSDLPTGVGSWTESAQKYTGDRYGASANYYDGKVYLTGGGCASLVATPNRTVVSTLMSQPQVARYSIAFDTDTDVYPSGWLLNGLDTSTGAKWQLKYQSMTDPGKTGGPNGTGKNCSTSVMTDWGQTTNFGNAILGGLGSYNPLDASGTNTACARYFYFNVGVDASQAYSFPDDTTRGPTITDLSLRFTADPSKRLLHGRTFVGGLQQPNDTPGYNN